MASIPTARVSSARKENHTRHTETKQRERASHILNHKFAGARMRVGNFLAFSRVHILLDVGRYNQPLLAPLVLKWSWCGEQPFLRPALHGI